MQTHERIRHWRTKKLFTISRLSREAGVDRAFIHEIEAGRKSPSVETIRKLATTLGVRFDDLISREEPNTKGN